MIAVKRPQATPAVSLRATTRASLVRSLAQVFCDCVPVSEAVNLCCTGFVSDRHMELQNGSAGEAERGSSDRHIAWAFGNARPCS